MCSPYSPGSALYGFMSSIIEETKPNVQYDRENLIKQAKKYADGNQTIYHFIQNVLDNEEFKNNSDTYLKKWEKNIKGKLTSKEESSAYRFFISRKEFSGTSHHSTK